MYSLTIAVGNTSWALMYKTAGDASIAAEQLQCHMRADKTQDFSKPSTIELRDDFGQTANVGSIHGFVLEDLNLSKQAHVERSLNHARTTVEAQNAWQNDPVARSAARGPAVLTPGMPNGGFRQ